MKKRHLILVLILFILTVASTYLITVNKNKIKTSNNNLPAYSRGAVSLGDFSISSISVKCVSSLPQVSISWSQSDKADSYSIERTYPWGGSWEDTGDTSGLSFTDATYELGYDTGDFSYRVKASSSTNGDVKYSNIQKINITQCGDTAPIATSTNTPAPITNPVVVTTPTVPAVVTPTTNITPTNTTTQVNTNVSSLPRGCTSTTKYSPTTGAYCGNKNIKTPVCSGGTTSACSITNGIGTESRVCNSGTWSSYSTCSVTSCNTGYRVNGNICAPIPAPIINTGGSTSTTGTLQWGAYVGDDVNDLANFESLVGKKVNLYADFEGWSNSFPSALSSKIGAQGKTLIIFWEPSFGYDNINSGSQDNYIKQFAVSAKSYSYPIILAPFDEMNLNEEAWGYGNNNNTAPKFKTAWQHIHDLFVANNATNVKFAITYNNDSVPNITGNKMADYYPGDSYVDYIGLDGFNFANPWITFAQVFDNAVIEASAFNKPMYILSTGSEAGTQKANWITDGLGTTIKKYTNVIGWVWFNQGGSPNWIVNSDSGSLTAFKNILPN